MTGIDRDVAEAGTDVRIGPEFPPVLDLVAPIIGLVGLIAAGIAAGGPAPLAVARTLVGAVFLGVVTDAMLLGHWYLVQPGLSRAPLNELVRWLQWTWPAEVVVLIWPVGMLSVLAGTVDDGWNGTLGWMWVACAVTTLGLAIATSAALRERQYSAVMAATGIAVPGDPDRIRHGPRRTGGARRLTERRFETVRLPMELHVASGSDPFKTPSGRANWWHGAPAVERKHQLWAGHDPREALQRGLPQERVVQPDRHTDGEPHQDEEGLVGRRH